MNAVSSHITCSFIVVKTTRWIIEARLQSENWHEKSYTLNLLQHDKGVVWDLMDQKAFGFLVSLDLNKCGLDSGSVAINIQSVFWQQIADT